MNRSCIAFRFLDFIYFDYGLRSSRRLPGWSAKPVASAVDRGPHGRAGWVKKDGAEM